MGVPRVCFIDKVSSPLHDERREKSSYGNQGETQDPQNITDDRRYRRIESIRGRMDIWCDAGQRSKLYGDKLREPDARSACVGRVGLESLIALSMRGPSGWQSRDRPIHITALEDQSTE